MYKRELFLISFIGALLCIQPSLMSCRIEVLKPIYTHDQALEIRTKLITDPLTCLAKQFNPLQDIQCAFANRQFSTAEQQAKFFESSECLSHFEQLPEDPILLLSECTFQTCQASRPFFEAAKIGRDFFDKFISSELYNQSKRKPVDYINIGSGGLFEDARILSIAHQKGAKSIRVHLIDPVYGLFLDLIKKNQVTDLDSFTIPTGKGSINSCLVPYQHAMFKAFVNYLTALYGKSGITFYIYNNAQECIDFLKEKTDSPHIMVVADRGTEEQALDAEQKIAQACFNKNSSYSLLGPVAMMHVYPSGNTMPQGFEDLGVTEQEFFNGIEIKRAVKKFTA